MAVGIIYVKELPNNLIFLWLEACFHFNFYNFDITAPAYNSPISWFPMAPLYRGSTVSISDWLANSYNKWWRGKGEGEREKKKGGKKKIWTERKDEK